MKALCFGPLLTQSLLLQKENIVYDFCGMLFFPILASSAKALAQYLFRFFSSKHL